MDVSTRQKWKSKKFPNSSIRKWTTSLAANSSKLKQLIKLLNEINFTISMLFLGLSAWLIIDKPDWTARNVNSYLYLIMIAFQLRYGISKASKHQKYHHISSQSNARHRMLNYLFQSNKLQNFIAHASKPTFRCREFWVVEKVPRVLWNWVVNFQYFLLRQHSSTKCGVCGTSS